MLKNYNKFAYNMKKEKRTDIYWHLVFLLIIFILTYSNLIMIIGFIIVMIIVIKLLYKYYKLCSFFKKMNMTDKMMIDNELRNPIFLGMDYTVTDSYIIDLNKSLLIPIKDITKIEKLDRITWFDVRTKLENYIVVYFKNAKCKYIISSKQPAINTDPSKTHYYSEFYNYLKSKRPDLF